MKNKNKNKYKYRSKKNHFLNFKPFFNNKFKGINIPIFINDGKKMINLFSDKYSQFLTRIKGTVISSKEDLIKVLNKRPKSLTTRLKKLLYEII
jgi:predicted component of viral defense system (DUF524 family)